MRKQTLDTAIAVCYTLFVFSGAYKSAWYFSWIPGDLTVLLGFVTVSLSLLLVLRGQLKLTRPALIITGLFGIFVAYGLLSGFWTESEHYYLSKLIRLIIVTGLALSIGALIISESYQRLKWAGITTVCVSTITALETLGQYVVAPGNVELYPFGTNYLITGRVIGLGILLTVAYLVFSRKDRQITQLALVATPIMGYALLVGGARGPMIMVSGAIGLLVLAGVVTGNLPNSHRAVVAYTALSGGVLIVLVTLAQQLRGMRRILILFDGGGSSLGTRFEYWSGTIDALDSNMIIFGEGLGSWPIYVYYLVDEQHYPHNIILEVLFELGIVGLVLLGSLCPYAVINVVREWVVYNRTPHLVIGIMFIYLLGNAMVSGDLNENRYLFAVLGIMAYSVVPPEVGIRRHHSARE